MKTQGDNGPTEQTPSDDAVMRHVFTRARLAYFGADGKRRPVRPAKGLH